MMYLFQYHNHEIVEQTLGKTTIYVVSEDELRNQVEWAATHTTIKTHEPRISTAKLVEVFARRQTHEDWRLCGVILPHEEPIDIDKALKTIQFQPTD